MYVYRDSAGQIDGCTQLKVSGLLMDVEKHSEKVSHVHAELRGVQVVGGLS